MNTMINEKFLNSFNKEGKKKLLKIFKNCKSFYDLYEKMEDVYSDVTLYDIGPKEMYISCNGYERAITWGEIKEG